MAENWTPGPWREFDGGPRAPCGIYPSPGEAQIAWVGSFPPSPADYANANLIAAAPELYAVLQKLLREDEEGCSLSWYEAEDALARARGEKRD